MEYSIKKLADLVAVTTRTLRYYDEIGLLKPRRINSSGYRIYGEKEIDLLQQILFYKSMDMKLEDIQKVISRPDFDIPMALIDHLQELVLRRNQLDQLISTVEKTISYNKGEIKMSNKEKLTENESKFGEEVREKYGEETIADSNKRFMNMSDDEFENMQDTEKRMFKSLKEIVKTKDLESETAKNVYENHKAWLRFTWTSYLSEAHIGLAEMYVEDERFSKYYNDRV